MAKRDTIAKMTGFYERTFLVECTRCGNPRGDDGKCKSYYDFIDAIVRTNQPVCANCLTPRELAWVTELEKEHSGSAPHRDEVLELLAKGKKPAQVATELGIHVSYAYLLQRFNREQE